MRYLLSEIAALCGGTFVGRDSAVTRVITDSRSESRRRDTGSGAGSDDTLFVAIRTANRDGAAYIGELYARGVRGFVVGEGFGREADFPDAGFVVVPDTIAALQALAAHYRKGFTGKVVGITGSYGKTTVKEWIAQLTPAGVSIFRSPKSYNSQIGVPLTVLMAEGTEDYTVIEAGISEPGEMAALQRIIRPDTGILTAIGGAHEDNFTSRGQLLDEKLKLFRDCPDVIKDGGSDAGFSERNAALAVDFWRREGYEIPEEAIRNLEPVAMRLEVKEGLRGSVLVNDTYNSDTGSLAIAFDHLARVAAGRDRTLIMADMVTAGGSEQEAYHRAAALVKDAGVEHFIGIGPVMMKHSGLFGAKAGKGMTVSFFSTADDFLRSFPTARLQGGVILVKGGARMNFDRVSHALERRSHTTVLEVDLDAILHNLRLCRSRLAPGVGVMPMIKASAYGHGTFEVARTLQGQGVDYLAVAFADEGVALRESGIAMPIVVLNADADSFEPMIRHRLEPEIYNFVSLGEFVALLKRHGEHLYPIHIKLDTGMHRLGFGEAEIGRLIEELARAERYTRVATIFSHLATADDPFQDDFTRRQIADFDRISSRLAASLPYPVRRHIANTKGIERFPEAHFDMVRLGLGLYGFGMDGARQAASLKTRIVSIADLSAGETVGYGRCGVLARPSRVATIPIGYADGLNRRLSGGAWSVLVGGVPAPIVGNVCMDSCMIDITGIGGNGHSELSGVPKADIKVGDEAVIFSAVPGNTVEDMAAALDTIPYEVMTSVSARVKRIYIHE